MRLTRPLQSIFSAGDGLIDRVLCVVGAVLCSQLPEFIQQYLQRLGGHLDEARRQLGQFTEIAEKSGLTFEQLMAKSQASSESSVAGLGQLMHASVTRVETLSAAETAIRAASVFTRPFVFLGHVDFSIARATWGAFRPAVPTTVEGVMYAALGMLLILAVYHGAVRYPLRRAWRRRCERSPTRGADPDPAPVAPRGDGNPGSGDAPGPAGSM
jgi:hypothetical protein